MGVTREGKAKQDHIRVVDYQRRERNNAREDEIHYHGCEQEEEYPGRDRRKESREGENEASENAQLVTVVIK